MNTTKIKKVYLNFIIKSFIQDTDKWAHIVEHDTYYTSDKFTITYDNCSIEVDNLAYNNIITVRVGSEYITFYNKLQVYTNRNFMAAYKYIKKYYYNIENSHYENSFINALPISDVRMAKLKNLLDI